MRSRIRFAFLALLLVGCDDATAPGPDRPPQRPPLSPPEFTVSGTVVGDSGAPVVGVVVTIEDYFQHTKTTTTDATGSFEFKGIAGTWMLTAISDGYLPEFRLLNVAGHRRLIIALIRGLQRFELGKPVLVHVYADVDPCDPVRWDAGAPCARIRFQAPRSGVLSVQVELVEGEVDFTIMSGDGQQYLGYGGSGQSQFATAPVLAGLFYEIWVHSYYGNATVTLKADLP